MKDEGGRMKKKNDKESKGHKLNWSIGRSVEV